MPIFISKIIELLENSSLFGHQPKAELTFVIPASQIGFTSHQMKNTSVSNITQDIQLYLIISDQKLYGFNCRAFCDSSMNFFFFLPFSKDPYNLLYLSSLLLRQHNFTSLFYLKEFALIRMKSIRAFLMYATVFEIVNVFNFMQNLQKGNIVK